MRYPQDREAAAMSCPNDTGQLVRGIRRISAWSPSVLSSRSHVAKGQLNASASAIWAAS